MGGEDDHSFGIRLGAFGPVGVVGVRLSAGPSRDGMLEVVEYLYVDVVGRAVERKQFAQARVVIVLVGQFQDWLAGQVAEPYYRATDEFVVPVAGGHLPGIADTGKRVGRTQVCDHFYVAVSLQA